MTGFVTLTLESLGKTVWMQVYQKKWGQSDKVGQVTEFACMDGMVSWFLCENHVPAKVSQGWSKFTISSQLVVISQNGDWAQSTVIVKK